MKQQLYEVNAAEAETFLHKQIQMQKYSSGSVNKMSMVVVLNWLLK